MVDHFIDLNDSIFIKDNWLFNLDCLMNCFFDCFDKGLRDVILMLNYLFMNDGDLHNFLNNFLNFSNFNNRDLFGAFNNFEFCLKNWLFLDPNNLDYFWPNFNTRDNLLDYLWHLNYSFLNSNYWHNFFNVHLDWDIFFLYMIHNFFTFHILLLWYDLGY